MGICMLSLWEFLRKKTIEWDKIDNNKLLETEFYVVLPEAMLIISLLIQNQR
jgi:hypothetical protein